MAKVIYIARGTGLQMSYSEWKAKRTEPGYRTVREYDNGVVQVTLRWSGMVPDPNNTLPEYWPVYVLLVKNYKSDGTLANDPVDSDKTFGSEQAGVSAYEEFLKRWTECGSDDSGGFVEADNLLAPIPPPSPDEPSAGDYGLGDTGAW